MPTTAAITFDVEADCPGIVDSYLGIHRGLPQILNILQEFNISATFFVTGDTALRFPRIIRALAVHHEVASHGLTHSSFSSWSPSRIEDLTASKKILENVTKHSVEGFRAPRLHVSPHLFTALAEIGFRYDSSLAWWIPQHRQLNPEGDGIAEFPPLLPNAVLRFPLGLQIFKTACLCSQTPLILYFHPGEAVDMVPLLQGQSNQIETLFWRPDRWVNTGRSFLNKLRRLLRFLRRRQFKFSPVRDL